MMKTIQHVIKVNEQHLISTTNPLTIQSSPCKHPRNRTSIWSPLCNRKKKKSLNEKVMTLLLILVPLQTWHPQSLPEAFPRLFLLIKLNNKKGCLHSEACFPKGTRPRAKEQGLTMAVSMKRIWKRHERRIQHSTFKKLILRMEERKWQWSRQGRPFMIYLIILIECNKIKGFHDSCFALGGGAGELDMESPQSLMLSSELEQGKTYSSSLTLAHNRFIHFL